ncbi:hypothetical protein [Flavobacterium sp. GT3R68]|uniref:hypothetical protein n=1 Tax=Flavobacterium sp. GT3R68 TaxID=2594437 RepID=UPI000F87DE3F|nr:hypothetical protein [Flavobacterium sp. GT3R68]RTY91357.1 hypothetical protein EKL32_19205 [Flavobacterium sp. GSN2]TRW93983.1 hypothetical protein FNW07_03470 [Flavobacterium sp. GT3R68]
MGLSFHYKGDLKTPQSLQTLIEEILDVAKSNAWDYRIFEDQFPNNAFTSAIDNSIYGISFNPPNCETVCFTFLSNGRMCPVWNFENANCFDPDEEGYLSIKTQFAGPEIHKQLIVLFDYLNKKYFANFDFIDEGNYWETKNEQLLKETFAKYSSLINAFDSLLETIPMEKNESVEEYLMRIAEMACKRKRNDDNQ